MADVAPAYREKVVTFGARESLVGVLSQPVEPRANTPHVVLINSGIVHRVGAHRSYVEFARALATAGVPALRFDLAGIGDSDRQPSVDSLQAGVRRDIAAAADFLAERHGATTFILAGLCSGAYDAFEYARVDARVSGACMIDMPGPFRNWSYVAYRAAEFMLRPTGWLAFAKRMAGVGRKAGDGGARGDAPAGVFMPGVRGHMPRERIETELDVLLERGVHIVFLFTGGVQDSYNHRLQFRLRFPRAASHPALTTEFIPWSDHTFSTRHARQYVTAFVRDWILQQIPEVPKNG